MTEKIIPILALGVIAVMFFCPHSSLTADRSVPPASIQSDTFQYSETTPDGWTVQPLRNARFWEANRLASHLWCFLRSQVLILAAISTSWHLTNAH
jgi:hypothetical protein